MRVLLVDDSELYRMTFAALLEEAGHAVTEAASLAQAGARLATAAFDLVVLDQHLEDGLGTSLVPEIRRQHPRAAIALVSGSGGTAAPAEVDLVIMKGEDPGRIIASLIAVTRAWAGA